MRYGSGCSGIESATAAWRLLGWKASFFSEIDPFARAVLGYRYPDIPLHGDFTTIQDGDYEPIDLLVAGTPCQSYSVAGLREGLDDPRGNLMLGFGALAERLRPKWLAWENVVGVLSSWSGAKPPSDLEPGQEWEGEEKSDFGCFLNMLENSGMGSPTAFLTLNISESPSAAAECSLSHILETGDLPQRFFLSVKACLGILKRIDRGQSIRLFKPPVMTTAVRTDLLPFIAGIESEE